MEKAVAIRLLTETLQRSFDEAQFRQLTKNLVNDLDESKAFTVQGNYIIESVTKEFFEQYKNLFLQVRDELQVLFQQDSVIAADFTQKKIDPANFAKKLLGQIVFLYFLQKKGWLGVEPGQRWGSGAKDFLRRLLYYM